MGEEVVELEEKNSGNIMESCLKAVLPPHLLVDSSISFGTEMALAFLAASRKVKEVMKDFPELMSKIDTKEMWAGTPTVAEEHEAIEKKIIEVIQNLEDGFGEIVKRVKTKQAIMTILHYQRGYIEKTFKYGMLQEKEFYEIEEVILDSINNIKRREETLINIFSCGLINDSRKLFDIEEEKPEKTFGSCPVISEMDEDTKKTMFNFSTVNLHQIGEEILKDRCEMFVVLKGIVVVKTDNCDVIETMPKGSIIGAYRYLSQKAPICKFTAKTVVEGRGLHQTYLAEVYHKSKKVRNAIAKQAGLELLKARYSKLFNEQLLMDTHVCEIMMSDSDVVDGDELSTWEGNFMLLVKGELHCERLEVAGKAASDMIARAPILITKCRSAKWLQKGILLVLHPERAKEMYIDSAFQMSKSRAMQSNQISQFIEDNSNNIDIDEIEDDIDQSSEDGSLKNKLKVATSGVEFAIKDLDVQGI